MLYTFSRLIQTSKDFCIDDSAVTYTNLTDTDTFIKREINNTVTNIFSTAREYKLQPDPVTVSTVAAIIYYDNPAGINAIESATMAVGSITHPLKIVDSQEEWNRLQMVSVSGGIPTHIFPRRDDFGIYPTPNGVYTVTLVGNYYPIPLSAVDVTASNFSITNGLKALTGTGFTAAMVGRWFAATDGTTEISNWYRIGAYVGTTALTLERTFTDTTVTAGNGIIAQVPEVPPSMHQFIPYRVAGVYYATRRKDADQARQMMNYYYTGDYFNDARRGNIKSGILGEINRLRELGRGNSGLVEMSGGYNNFMIPRDGIWGITLS